ncbi:hypothetical protein HAX54_024408, partial [Datura stramonium]|nr:hypothetical protein [Datura stramonium]
MEYHVAFKEKRCNHAEAQFEVYSFKNAFPNIYEDQQWILKNKGRTETLPCLPSVWVHGQEVPITPEAINLLYWVK